MFDFDAGKLLIIGVVALIVIGPKDLPRVLRQVGQMVSRVRRMAGEFQGQFMEAMKEADLQDLRAEVAKLKDTARIDVDFDPARDLKSSLLTAVDGTGSPASGGVAAPGLAPPASAPSIADGGTALLDEPPPSPPRASKSFPLVDAPTPSLASAGTGPAGEASPPLEPAPFDAVAGQGARRKIRINRRPSRFDGAVARDAVPARSRNILPARPESPDR